MAAARGKVESRHFRDELGQKICTSAPPTGLNPLLICPVKGRPAGKACADTVVAPVVVTIVSSTARASGAPAAGTATSWYLRSGSTSRE